MSEAPYRYTAAVADEIERRWQQRWDEEGTFFADNPVGSLRATTDSLAQAATASSEPAEKMYIMDMFPYPSGSGLHVGHPLGYIATDVVARHQRMMGKNVLYTMGYDAFGLPAEQYAVQTGMHPRTTTESNVANMRRQLHRLGLSHDSRRSLATTDPEFMKWTQWIFLRIFDSWYDPEATNADGITGRARPIAELRAELRAGTWIPLRLADRQSITLPETWVGRSVADVTAASDAEIFRLADSFRLTYISETPVNWCPGLGTVLANEEVTTEGRSERGNFPVVHPPPAAVEHADHRLRRPSDRRSGPGGLARVDPFDAAQLDRPQRWRADHLPRSRTGREPRGVLRRLHMRADTLFGVTFFVLSPEHSLLEDPSALPAQWPEGTKDAWTGGAATPRAAVEAYRVRAASLGEDERTAEDREKTGVFTGLIATNPMDGREVPVFTADYVLMGYGTGAIMAVPAEDERDFAFADRFELPIIRTVKPADDFEGGAWTGDGEKINSANADLDLNGLDKDEAKARATLVRRGPGLRACSHHIPPAGLAVLPPALLGRAVPDRLRPRAPRGADPAARVDAASRPARGRGLLPQDVRSDGRRHRTADSAVAGGRLGGGRAGSG